MCDVDVEEIIKGDTADITKKDELYRSISNTNDEFGHAKRVEGKMQLTDEQSSVKCVDIKNNNDDSTLLIENNESKIDLMLELLHLLKDPLSVDEIITYILKTQYQEKHTLSLLVSEPIITKQDLRNNVDTFLTSLTPEQKKTLCLSRTSGTTGEPVMVPKSDTNLKWFAATNMIDLMWHEWTCSANDILFTMLAVTKTRATRRLSTGCIIYEETILPLRETQQLLEELQPTHIYTYPSIIKYIDTTKLMQLRDIRSCGEIGATSYSSEETGTIALSCPEEKSYHIMDNIQVETDNSGRTFITDFTNPFIQKYDIGDVCILASDDYVCPCGRTNKVIKNIVGRVRGMLLLCNGDRIWPIIGEPMFGELFPKIRRHQAVQKTLDLLIMKLCVNDKMTNDEETNFISFVKTNLKIEYMNVVIEYVVGFDKVKFEPFICEI